MGSACCCFRAQDPAEEEENINNEAPGLFPNLYNQIMDYAASINNNVKEDSENSSTGSGSTQEEYVRIVQSPNSQGSNLEQGTTSPAPDNVKELKLNSENSTSEEKVTETVYFYPPIEREDECPTCLEEYTPENPKMTMQCSHNFHLACIYEWMERSHSCPICSRVMLFDGIEAS